MQLDLHGRGFRQGRRRYMGVEFLAKVRLRIIEGNTPDLEIDQQELTA